MAYTEPQAPRPPVVSNPTVAMVVYVLYFVGYFTGITALIGVIVAHIQVGSADAFLQSHYRFQIRTFWVGVLWGVIGVLLFLTVIGIVIGYLFFLWAFIWSLIRNIKGILALNEGRPIANPTSWLFG